MNVFGHVFVYTWSGTFMYIHLVMNVFDVFGHECHLIDRSYSSLVLVSRTCLF